MEYLGGLRRREWRCASAPGRCWRAAPCAYGLAAAGEAGVARAIDILRTDLIRTLKLLGCRSVAELDRSYVDLPGAWQ